MMKSKYYELDKNIKATIETKPIRAMIYTRLTSDGKILYDSIYKGYRFYVISYGSHPCCYIVIDRHNKYYGKDYNDIPLDVHGGLTFSSKYHPSIETKINEWIIGWDYAHYGDRFGMILTNDHYNHTWKTKELIKECIDAINKLEVISNG